MSGWGNCLYVRTVVTAAAMLLAHGAQVSADDTAVPDISDESFLTHIQPLLIRYCYDCHSAGNVEADLDLAESSSLPEIRQQISAWLKIRSMLDSGQMPPKGAAQPEPEESEQLRRWVSTFLTEEARRHAGDPGPTILRRLNNEEYNYTVRDLTGIPSLDPTREFPVDGAAGEGFINSGAAQAMSPALVQKYFDAAQEIAGHLVLLPDGITFSRHTTRRDQTDDCLARIQEFYRRYTVETGLQPVQLSGFETSESLGGVLPLQRYLQATLEERPALADGSRSIADVCQDRSLIPKYLDALWAMLTAEPDSPSFLLDEVRRRWRESTPDDVAALTTHIENVQNTLWKFNAVGHIGQDGRPRTWMEPSSPVVTLREFSVELPPSDQDIVISLAAVDAGDGSNGDHVLWQNPRLTGKGTDIPLSRLNGLQEQIRRMHQRDLEHTASMLAAADEVARSSGRDDSELPALAARHRVDPGALGVWLRYLGISEPGAAPLSGHFRDRYQSPDYAFISGWGSSDTPSIVSNASDSEVRIPGVAPPHSVLVHPSPTQFAAVGWRSPLTGAVTLSATVADAHPECGNGQEWIVQHRTADAVSDVEQGHFGPGGSAELPSVSLDVRRGDVISLIVGPHQQAHSCDLTSVNLIIEEAGGENRRWDLAADVNRDIDAANPHPDSHGHPRTWHFFQGDMSKVAGNSEIPTSVPPGSLLDLWRTSQDADRRAELAEQIQVLVTGPEPNDPESPNGRLYRRIRELVSPLNRLQELLANAPVDPRFGHPGGPDHLAVSAPEVTTIVVPAALAAGRTLVTEGRLNPDTGSSGAVRLEVSTASLAAESIPLSSPVVVSEGSETQQHIEQAFRDFRQLFAPTLCYTRIVPIDEVVTITLFYRQDDLLRAFLLNDDEAAELERLWDELWYVSQEPRLYQVAFEQNRAFATQDRPDLVEKWAPLAEAVEKRLADFERQLLDSEPTHVESLLEFAERAWRRPLSGSELSDLKAFYQQLRESELAHEQSVRLTLARILTSPVFLYRREQPGAGSDAVPVTGQELATRLSYFLWSSTPDATLQQAVDSGQLTHDDRLLLETRRMLADDRIRRLSVQFACQWLHLRNFDRNDDKNEALYPEFASLRDDMYEETVLFFEDLFRSNRSVLSLLDGDHTFLNESLARHYGIGDVHGDEWQRVGDMRSRQRGGLLTMASLLASQSGASRTSPILRGNWISETLLGERLPRPPANVPQLPDAVPEGLTARQLIELHSSVPECAKCHAKIDPYGFALEQYDAIGRLRPEAVDTSTTLEDGQQIDGIQGLRRYLRHDRRDDVVRQFCRKLLGFALGRAVQLSDEPLLDTMVSQLKAADYRSHTAIEAVVLSPQFRRVRGIEFASSDE